MTGRRLRELREGAGMTLRELSNEAGVSFSHLAKAERGDVTLTADVERRALMALCTLGHLQTAALAEAYRELSERLQSEALTTDDTDERATA